MGLILYPEGYTVAGSPWVSPGGLGGLHDELARAAAGGRLGFGRHSLIGHYGDTLSEIGSVLVWPGRIVAVNVELPVAPSRQRIAAAAEAEGDAVRLAEAIGVPPRTVQRWIRGERTPRGEAGIRLVKYLWRESIAREGPDS